MCGRRLNIEELTPEHRKRVEKYRRDAERETTKKRIQSKAFKEAARLRSLAYQKRAKESGKAKQYYDANREKRKAYMAEYRSRPDVKERLREQREVYYKREDVKQRIKEYSKKRLASSVVRDKINERRRPYSKKRYQDPLIKKRVLASSLKWSTKKYASDVAYNIKMRARAALYGQLKKRGVRKIKRCMEIVGCTKEELIRHLETTFQPGMSWDKRHLLHIDHIKPCCSFDFTKKEQVEACFHYTNLRVLWASDNLAKLKQDKLQSIHVKRSNT